METINTRGLVIKQTNYGEADRILHIFTEEMGIISAIAKGARKYKSHQGSASQLLYYSDFHLVPSKSGMYTLRGATVVESFFALSQNLSKLSLCTYLFDITKSFVPEQVVEKDVLSLLLNTLYILETKDRSEKMIKAVYEFKLLALTGFMAMCDECIICQNENEAKYFSPTRGGIICADCLAPADSIEISSSVLSALRYIIQNDTDKIFSFTLPEDAMEILASVCEKFLLANAEKSFLSLSYYKTVSEI